jgi:gluconolactonase
MPSDVTVGAFVVEDERFRPYTQANAPLVKLAEGFAWLEGPVWFADHDCLLFSDLPNDRIMRWSDHGGLSVFRAPCGFENGHARDMQGRLLGCSHRNRCITRTELDGSVTVLADRYEGKRLNSPNDVVCRSDGTIWFSDPHYGINTDYEGGKQTAELPAKVYRLDPDGALHVVADDFAGPNGLCFSPDERLLYIAEAGLKYAADPVRHIRVFDVSDDGLLARAHVFHTVLPGYADGFCCDEDGNVWSGAGDGVHCVAPDGQLIGRIPVPFTVSNLAFGGRNRARLFLCASHTLFAIYTNARGIARP